MDVAVITAAISFGAAVIAVVVGQVLGQRYQRAADDRRWEREDAARRRLRGEEAARSARKALNSATAMFEASWIESGGRSSRWEFPDDELLGEVTRRAQDLAIEIPDDHVRSFVRLASYVLDHAGDANQGGAPPPWKIAWAVAAETDAVIGAYLRGEVLPPATEVDAAAIAAAEWRAQIAALEAEHRARERADPKSAGQTAVTDGP